MFNKILVPLDGSDVAEGVLPYASQLAAGLDARLVLLSVIDPGALELPSRLAGAVAGLSQGGSVPPSTPYGPGVVPAAGAKPAGERVGPGEDGPYVTQLLEALKAQTGRRLDRIARRLEADGVKAEATVSIGATPTEIVRVAEAKRCDLIAMSTHGRTQIGRGILGSVTDKVVHSSKLPTLTITPAADDKHSAEAESISTIIVPLDGSALAEAVLPYVEALAQGMSLKVLLARVIGTAGVYPGDPAAFSGLEIAELEKEVESEAIDYLNDAAGRLRSGGVEVQWDLSRGSAAGTISGLARRTPRSMVALTSHGRTGMARWLLGSVAETLVRATGSPVLIVPAKRR